MLTAGAILTSPLLAVASRVSQGYGGSSSNICSGFHNGIDFAAPLGTRILAPGPGVVVGIGTLGLYGGAGGNHALRIRLRDGNHAWLLHMQRDYVALGQSFDTGTLLAEVGCEGNCSGPHLHLSITPNGAGLSCFGCLNPEPWAYAWPGAAVPVSAPIPTPAPPPPPPRAPFVVLAA